MNEWNEWMKKCEDFKCVWKPTESRLCLTHYVNKSSLSVECYADTCSLVGDMASSTIGRSLYVYRSMSVQMCLTSTVIMLRKFRRNRCIGNSAQPVKLWCSSTGLMTSAIISNRKLDANCKLQLVCQLNCLSELVYGRCKSPLSAKMYDWTMYGWKWRTNSLRWTF